MPGPTTLLACFFCGVVATSVVCANEVDPSLNISVSNQCMSRLDQECFTSCGEGMACSRGRCYCDWGTCAGLDDKCYSGQYELLPGSYTLTNARWPEYRMIQEGLGRTEVSDYLGGERGIYSEFYISVVHAPSNGEVAIMLRSKEHLDYAVAMTDITRRSGYSFEYRAKGLGASTEVEDVASLLYKPPKSDPHPNASMVMLRGVRHPAFAYVPTMAKGVYGHKTDKGAGAYWYISPPLPDSLVKAMPAYTGELCQSDCGDVDMISGAAQAAISITVMLLGLRPTF